MGRLDIRAPGQDLGVEAGVGIARIAFGRALAAGGEEKGAEAGGEGGSDHETLHMTSRAERIAQRSRRGCDDPAGAAI